MSDENDGKRPVTSWWKRMRDAGGYPADNDLPYTGNAWPCPPGKTEPPPVVVELDGRAFDRGDDGQDVHLMGATAMLGAAAIKREITMLWAVAEVQTPEGPRIAVIRYGVGTYPGTLVVRLRQLVDEFAQYVTRPRAVRDTHYSP